MSGPLPGREQNTQILVLGRSIDDAEDFALVLESLGEPLAWKLIGGFDELRQSLSTDRRQIVISNDELARSDLLAAIGLCKAPPHDVPFIVVSDNPTPENGSALIRAGVQDYVTRNHVYRLLWVVQRELLDLRLKREKAEIEKQARRTESRLAKLLELAPDAIIAADNEHRIIVFNRGAERIFGYSADEIIGRDLGQLMPERFARHHLQSMLAFTHDAIKAREMGGRRELVGLRKDGTEFPSEASISVVEEKSGLVFFAVLRDVTEKRRAAQNLEYLATHDALTSLPNRLLFADRLSHAIALAEREEKLVALLFVDLDGFKGVNDSVGHKGGDELLCVTATRLRASVRRSDTVARLGGDEFAVILERIEHVDTVTVVAEQIINRLREPFLLGGEKFVVSASIGITLCPFDTKDPEELMVDADRAMYAAKGAGKNRFEFYSPELAGIGSGKFAPMRCPERQPGSGGGSATPSECMRDGVKQEYRVV